MSSKQGKDPGWSVLVYLNKKESAIYREFYAACKLGDLNRLKKIDLSLTMDHFENPGLILSSAIYAAKYKHREIYMFLLQAASDFERDGWTTLRDEILREITKHFTQENDLETIDWLIAGELNSTDAVLICNEVLYTAACDKNVPIEDWVFNKYAHYVDVTHENHRTLRSVVFPMHHESIERLFDEYQKTGKEKIAFIIIIDEAIKHEHVALLKLVIEDWADGFDVREMKPNSQMDPACREYLTSVIELQNMVGIEEWKELVRTKEAMDLKPKKTKLW